MTREADILRLVRQNTKNSPGKALDMCCGVGYLVRGLSAGFPRSEVYGLDKNRESLALGIVRGNFERATPIHGDAYEITSENPDFTVVHYDPKYFRGGCIDLNKIKHRKFGKPLRDIDLVTAVNTTDWVSANEFGKIQTGEIKRGPMPLEIVSYPTKEEGLILYENEIAHTSGMIRPTPAELNKEVVGNFLEERIKEGENAGLGYVSHDVINGAGGFFGSSVDLAVLFKKLKSNAKKV